MATYGKSSSFAATETSITIIICQATAATASTATTAAAAASDYNNNNIDASSENNQLCQSEVESDIDNRVVLMDEGDHYGWLSSIITSLSWRLA
jgi:hypothetical protein